MKWLDQLGNWARGAEPQHALVIGAGATGLTSAIFLDACGVRSKIIEQLSAPARSRRSSILTGATLEGYDSVGLMGEILRVSNPYARRIINVGQQRLDPRLKAPAGSRIMPHTELIEILEQEVERRWLPVLRGKKVISVNQSLPQAYAIIDNGGRMTATHIVAADGAGSVANGAINAPALPQRVRGWKISGATRIATLPAHLAREINTDVTLMASTQHMHFVAQMDDPSNDEQIAWSAYLRAEERVNFSAVTIADRQEQVVRAVRTLKRFAQDAVGLVQASHGLAVRAAIATGPAAARSLGRIVTVGSAFHGDAPFSPAASSNSYAEAMQVPARIDLLDA